MNKTGDMVVKNMLIIFFLLFLNIPLIYANDCVDPMLPSEEYVIEAKIVREKNSAMLGLSFTIKNTSNNELRIPWSIFDRKSIKLSLIPSISLTIAPLIQEQSLIHPHMSEGTLILNKGEVHSEIINLRANFKGLSKSLNISSVVVFWYTNNEISSNDLCYEKGGYFVLPKVFSQEHEDRIKYISEFLMEQQIKEPLPESMKEINLRLKKILESKNN